ncbi:hypothetical protein HanRHA438_Chr05g0239771 [Helianthus annuus]|uniref:Uncharacterized protein n=1 Tax=Helianthus annuus TaxID=4232 RepID=A0A9K3NNJ7_HELAN|nr:hypothetical protein HanXRQr2_Chr05g0230581 [Helianthus annuus]KAJ0585693.1 hypothetical protein HanHA89_Chr05g0203591 [Helianthus annuus]KAJ0920302.1 hypothetical protein HanRHA438_Chr05g0239771 [Helianthus annuus]KAJ0923934.1 hypothetical protein HanPSC8_Chr05g0222411 [Helianthus annuus]
MNSDLDFLIDLRRLSLFETRIFNFHLIFKPQKKREKGKGRENGGDRRIITVTPPRRSQLLATIHWAIWWWRGLIGLRLTSSPRLHTSLMTMMVIV